MIRNVSTYMIPKWDVATTSHARRAHPATKRCGDIITRSLHTPQQRRRCMSNETPNFVSMKSRQGVSVVRLHDVLTERCDDISRVCNNEVSSVYLHDVSNKSQLKQPTTSQWYVFTMSYWNFATTSQEDITMTFYQYVSTTSQTSLNWNVQQRLSGTLPRRLSGMYPRRAISTFLRRLLQAPKEAPNNVAVVRLHQVLQLRCCDALLLDVYYVFKLLCHNLHLVGFHIWFKYQINYQISTRKAKRGVVWIIN